MNNTKWVLQPNISINGIEFGTSRNVIRSILGKPKKVFKKTSDADNPTDVYENYHVYYSSGDKLEAVEFFGDNIVLGVNSQNVFPGTLSEAKKAFPDLTGSNACYTSKSCSVGICTEDENIVSILVGRKDYYM